MWEAWTQAIAAASADSPGRMPWQKASEAAVITQESAHRVMVRVLEEQPTPAQRLLGDFAPKK